MALLLLPCIIAWPATGFGADDSGMSLEVFADQAHPDLKYVLGEPIKIIMVMKNRSEWSINTERAFKDVQLENALMITDPGGTRHSISKDSQTFDMPPPFFWNDMAATPAQSLPQGWVRSVTIEDLGVLLPMMHRTPGWYTIEAYQPFIRFAWTIEDSQLGLLGIQDDKNNWFGTVNAKKLQIYISPALGAKLKVQVVEVIGESVKPVAQVPVKVYLGTGEQGQNLQFDLNADGSVNLQDLPAFAGVFGRSVNPGAVGDGNNDGDIDGGDLLGFIAAIRASGTGPQQLWQDPKPVMAGTSDFEGWVVWDSQLGCLPEDDYVVIAYYGGEYEQTLISEGADTGWNVACEDTVAERVFFGGVPPQPPAIPGDFNGDQCVDRDDYFILMDDIRDGLPNDPAHDLNEDGAVNRADARTLAGLFTNPRGAPCN
jgi:hypothetical protein